MANVTLTIKQSNHNVFYEIPTPIPLIAILFSSPSLGLVIVESWERVGARLLKSIENLTLILIQ